jgi:hypothetical protein
MQAELPAISAIISRGDAPPPRLYQTKGGDFFYKPVWHNGGWWDLEQNPSSNMNKKPSLLRSLFVRGDEVSLFKETV